MTEEEKQHQLHISISQDMHDNLKKILPEYGAVTGLIRSFLRQYLNNYKNLTKLSESPFDKAANSVFKSSLLAENKGENNGT